MPAPTSLLTYLAPRALVVAALDTVIAVALTVFGPEAHSFGKNWIYSLCIGMPIWLLIDGGRFVFEREGRISGGPLALLALAGTVGGYLIGTLLADLLTGQSTLAFWSRAPRSAIGILLMSIAFGLAASFYFSSRAMLADARTRAEAAQRQASEARLRLLETQLEPHMLFNTLANLQALIAVDPPAAQRMLDRLIAYLRATLAASRAGSHPLSAEFERLRDYLELMTVRMGPRLRYTLTLPDALKDVAIPPLLLQPLVENSIRHGLEPKVEGGCIDISAQRDGDMIRLTVADDGLGLRDSSTPAFDGKPGDDRIRGGASARQASAIGHGAGSGAVVADRAGHQGFGLNQVSERLATSFGPRARMQVAAGQHGGTIITLSVPMPQ